MKELKGKTAIVTGGSRGIGRAIVLKLASLGVNVAFNYASNKDAADTLLNEISADGGKVMAQQVDIREFDSVKTWIAQVQKDLGPVDILINNAGIIDDRSLMMMTEEAWSKVIHTDLNGVFNATRSCIVEFLKQKRGDVINISSISGVIGLVGQVNYSAAKGGVNAFTKALAKEVAPRGVRVNAVAPGFVETEILSGFNESDMKEITDTIPLKRIGQCEDVVNCVLFLLSDAAKYITGQIINVDGGLAIR